jgi:hypothetical protein
MTLIRDNIPLDGMGDGAYLIGGYDNNRTNAMITLAAKATPYRPGTILGKVTGTLIHKPLDPTANDGTQNFAAINFSAKPARASAQRGAGTVREATLQSNLLFYENAVTAEQKAQIEAQMAAVGIISGY